MKKGSSRLLEDQENELSDSGNGKKYFIVGSIEMSFKWHKYDEVAGPYFTVFIWDLQMDREENLGIFHSWLLVLHNLGH